MCSGTPVLLVSLYIRQLTHSIRLVCTKYYSKQLAVHSWKRGLEYKKSKYEGSKEQSFCFHVLSVLAVGVYKTS